LNVCLGGTFSPLHKGHMKLLREAFLRGDLIMVGLTSDRMAKRERERHIESYTARKTALERVLVKLSREYGKEFTVRKIEDPVGFADGRDVASLTWRGTGTGL
jgi:pantetheine-phosphate adenylyltransferase